MEATAAMTTQVEYVSAELEDFLQFRGRQTFAFARPGAGERCGLTIVAGSGGSGKTSLVTALRLALWGARRVSASGRLHFRLCRYGNVFAPPSLFINGDALRGLRPRARVRLTMRVTASVGAPTTMVVTRSWHVLADGAACEGLVVETEAAGRKECLERSAAQRRISALLPPGRLPHLFSGGEQCAVLGRLASIRPPVSESAEQELEAITGGFPKQTWRAVAPAIIAFGNCLLASDPGSDELRLLPEAAGRRWSGAYPVVPGVWVTREPEWCTHVNYVGQALGVGLHLSGDTRAPLVLDAPMMRMNPCNKGILLEAMCDVALPQVVVAAHECQIDELAVALWQRVNRIYLVENLRDVGTSLLSEPLVGRRAE